MRDRFARSLEPSTHVILKSHLNFLICELGLPAKSYTFQVRVAGMTREHGGNILCNWKALHVLFTLHRSVAPIRASSCRWVLHIGKGREENMGAFLSDRPHFYLLRTINLPRNGALGGITSSMQTTGPTPQPSSRLPVLRCLQAAFQHHHPNASCPEPWSFRRDASL